MLRCVITLIMSMLLLVTLPVNAGRLSFFVFGDFGKESSLQENVSQSMNSRAAKIGDVAFAITLGDNFYDDIPLKSSSRLFEDIFEDEYDLPFTYYIVLGNHDVLEKKEVEAEIEYTTDSSVDDWTGRWHLPSRYYTVTKTFKSEAAGTSIRTDFVMIDTSLLVRYGYGASRKAADKHWKWIEKSLQAAVNNGAHYIIVAGHHYLYKRGNIENTSLAPLLPLMQKYGVTAYLSGHSHAVEIQQVNGIYYIMTGAATKTTRGSERDKSLFEMRKTGSFSHVIIDDCGFQALHYDEYDKLRFIGPVNTRTANSYSLKTDVCSTRDPSCTHGIINRRNSVCCASKCGACSGSGCASRLGGSQSCCEGVIAEKSPSCSHSLPPCIIDSRQGFGPGSSGSGSSGSGSSGSDVNCSSGKLSSSGQFCCASTCSRCGGPGCSSLSGGPDKCCLSRIRQKGLLCAKVSSAPCSMWL